MTTRIPRTHRETLISNEFGDQLRRSGRKMPTAYRIGPNPTFDPVSFCDPSSSLRTIYQRECPCCGSCLPADAFDDRFGNRLGSSKYARACWPCQIEWQSNALLRIANGLLEAP